MSIYLTHIKLRNFRCFSEYEVIFDNPITLITGANGTGKTTLLEALYYTCYLRSFRSYSPKELIQAGHDSFFVQVHVANRTDNQQHMIQIGFTGNRRLIKIDEKPIASYKELLHNYRVIGVTEDDMALVKEGPEARRAFIDHAMVLLQPDYAGLLREYHHLIEQRNALLQTRAGGQNRELYDIITSQVWHKAYAIVQIREQILQEVCLQIELLVEKYFMGQIEIAASYKPRRHIRATLEDFLEHNPSLYDQERRFERTLFGPHVDDIQIAWGRTQARQFASRGQQKLIVVLFKIALAQRLKEAGWDGILLLDDFMTDFDKNRAQRLLEVLEEVGCQLIITSPSEGGLLTDHLSHVQRIQLTI